MYVQTKNMKRKDELLSYLATPERIKQRRFWVAGKEAVVLFNPNITDLEMIRTVIYAMERSKSYDLETIAKDCVFAAELEIKPGEVMDDLMVGNSVVIIDKVPGYLVISTPKWDKRAIAESTSESVLHGPRESFIEDIKTNLSLLERKLRTPALAIEKMKIGRLTNTTVALCYISTVADPRLVNLIRERLKKIDVDGIIDSHFLEPFIVNHPYSMFSQVGNTEKPDVVAAKLLEGRVAIMIDGSPMVLTVPFLLLENYHNPEDHYDQVSFVSFLRGLRFFAILLAIILPGVYVALQVYHFNVIPLKFLITIINSVEGIPLSPLPELLLVLLLFEVIREASVRMPRGVGMAMSIVGALVLGETAVSAGMISPPAVMIIALSSIALYTAPDEVPSVSILRIFFVLFGGIAGIYGIISGIILLIVVLVNFDSFGSPYLAPFAPLILPDLKDSIFRSSIIDNKTRPFSIPNINSKRINKK